MHLMKSLCCAAAIALLAASVAHADEWNRKTYLTFSGPVQIPGATLPAGTYLFQLADPDNSRHVVMVSSKDGTRVYGMFLTIPNDRINTPEENVVMFGESPAGAPLAVQAWWYPGERIGEEFVYPKGQAMAIAKANHREVLATASDVTANSANAERMAAVRGEKVGRIDENGNMNGERNKTATAPQTTTAAATTTAPSNTVNGRSANTAKTTTARTNTTASNAATGTSGRTTLPRTASNLELVELLSALSFVAAFLMRRLRGATHAQ